MKQLREFLFGFVLLVIGIIAFLRNVTVSNFTMFYQMNGFKTFLKNNLRVSMNLDKGLGVMNYNGKNTDISVKPHKYSFTDEFKLLHTCEINSLFAYVCFPGALLTIKNRMQSLNMECMSSYNSLLYKLKLGNNYFNNEVGVDYERQYLSCDIDSQK